MNLGFLIHADWVVDYLTNQPRARGMLPALLAAGMGLSKA